MGFCYWRLVWDHRQLYVLPLPHLFAVRSNSFRFAGVFFVVQSSQRRSIRTIQTGETAMSSVRRPSLQRQYIREVSKQTTVIKLQGFLFFGTIAYVEETIRSLIDAPSWKRNPIRFLVLDLSLVAGVDMSSAEAFVRIQRLLYGKAITLVFCGFQAGSSVGQALGSVGVLESSGVELFSTLNDAMECEFPLPLPARGLN